MQASVDYAATVGKRRLGTTTQRNALTYVEEGLRFRDTTDGIEYDYKSGAWAAVSPGPWTAPALAAGITVTAGRVATQYRSVPGAVEVLGTIDGSGASGYVLFTLPVGFRPSAEVRIWADVGGTVQILSNGVVSSTLTGVKTALSFQGRFPV
ncbi:hypothetical protein [Cryobacterium fucosi]|uniref:Uncharacterized protein n=1 Tax=Cryobacterium fucosi TaxID=1259157 RepID=A0A4R9B4Y0_9MICO|nr:hypothetical protein [Cryobacterium fucosi]TFD74741.1 hypothetical protein E3T48_12510 [Cryobacterium fucosi]